MSDKSRLVPCDPAGPGPLTATGPRGATRTDPQSPPCTSPTRSLSRDITLLARNRPGWDIYTMAMGGCQVGLKPASPSRRAAGATTHFARSARDTPRQETGWPRGTQRVAALHAVPPHVPAPGSGCGLASTLLPGSPSDPEPAGRGVLPPGIRGICLRISFYHRCKDRTGSRCHSNRSRPGVPPRFHSPTHLGGSARGPRLPLLSSPRRVSEASSGRRRDAF